MLVVEVGRGLCASCVTAAAAAGTGAEAAAAEAAAAEAAAGAGGGRLAILAYEMDAIV